MFADRILTDDGKTVLLFRCDTDGCLVTSSEESMKDHLGHRIKAPVFLKPEELEQIEKGLIK